MKLAYAPIISTLPFVHKRLAEQLAANATTEETPASGLADLIMQLSHRILNKIGFSSVRADIWDRLLIFLGILILALVIWVFCAKVLLPGINYLISRSKLQLDRTLYQRHFFHRIFELMPPLTILIWMPLAWGIDYPKISQWLTEGLVIYLTIVISRILTAFVMGGFDYYLLRRKMEISPYKSAIEMCKIVIKVFMILCICGILLNLNLAGVVTGLSAFAAVLVLVFKDTVLGFIAGMQLLQNRMLRIGDWIEIENTAASGYIEEITIMTIRVRNFDNTFSFVPAYSLMNRTFMNWAGMKQSGKRRSDKTLLLDVDSICQLSADEVDAMLQHPLLKQLLPDDKTALFHKSLQDDASAEPAVQMPDATKSVEDGIPDASVVTSADTLPLDHSNIGLFRRWCYLYLSCHPWVDATPYIVIRNLTMTGNGFPLQFLYFVKSTKLSEFEACQSAIIEQLLILLPVFNLRPFQYKTVSLDNIN